MEQILQLNKVTSLPKKNEKAITLKLTDITLHSNVRPTKSIGRVLSRSIKDNNPGRIYSSLEVKSFEQDKGILKTILPLILENSNLRETVLNYQQQGYRVFLEVPKEGLPIKLGNDAQEFITSTKGNRILRKIKKDKGC